MKNKTVILFLLLSLLILGCSQANYKRTNPDGTVVEASASEFGTDKKIQGFEYEADSNSVKVKLKDLDSDQTTGIEQLNQFVGAIVQGAIKGAK